MSDSSKDLVRRAAIDVSSPDHSMASSPLVFSECSSPPPEASPPPPPHQAPPASLCRTSAPPPPVAALTSAAAFTNVLTHEKNDPMLSAAAAAQPFSPTRPRLSVSSCEAATFSPPEQPQAQTQPQVQPQQKRQPQPQRHTSNEYSSADGGNGILSLPPGLDPAACVDPPRGVRLNLLGCFAVKLRLGASASVAPATSSFSVHVFDGGCACIPGEEAHAQVLAQLRTPRGVSFDAVCAKQDPARATSDKVFVQVEQDEIGAAATWLALGKPGKATDALQMLSVGKSFFLQKTAFSRVAKFFKSNFHQPWIVSSVLILNVNAPDADANEDFRLLSAVPNQPPPPPPPPPAPAPPTTTLNSRQIRLPTEPLPPSETLHLSSGTLTLHAAAASPSSLRPPIATGRQYAALTPEQSLHCTSCNVCRRNFRYVMEHLLHFAMSTTCRTYVLKTRGGGGKPQNQSPVTSAASTASQTFYALLSSLLASRCGLTSTQLACDLCAGATFSGPMQYAMHRDEHRPASADVFLCQFCARLFRTPHAFFRHPCIKFWNAGGALKRLEDFQNAASLTESDEDAFKIYGRLDESERQTLLSCPACAKRHSYVSGLVSHLKTSASCLADVAQNCAGADEESLDLSGLIFSRLGLSPRRMSCESCATESENQLGYAVHRDHHGLRRQGTLCCKVCNSEYRTPCEFYRHACAGGADVPDGARLCWCPFCEVCAIFDRKKKEIVDKNKDCAREGGVFTGNFDLDYAACVTGITGVSGAAAGANGANGSGDGANLVKKNRKRVKKNVNNNNKKEKKSFSPLICTECSPFKILNTESERQAHDADHGGGANAGAIKPLAEFGRLRLQVPDVRQVVK